MELSRTNDDLNRICAKQMRNRWQMNKTFVGNSVNISHWKRERNHIEHAKTKTCTNRKCSIKYNRRAPPSLSLFSSLPSPSFMSVSSPPQTRPTHKTLPIPFPPLSLTTPTNTFQSHSSPFICPTHPSRTLAQHQDANGPLPQNPM